MNEEQRNSILQAIKAVLDDIEEDTVHMTDQDLAILLTKTLGIVGAVTDVIESKTPFGLS